MGLEKNIPLMYVRGALLWGRFHVPVLALFYIASQVPLEQFALIMALFAATILILEVPSGVVADFLGKKKTLMLSAFMYIIEIFLLAFFNGFWFFLIAKVISGIGVSLSSGAAQALVYDTLKKLDRTKEHKRISGNIATITNVSMAVTFIIGAYLFTVGAKLPAMVSLPFMVMGFLLTFFLKEPYKNGKKFDMKNSWNHLKEGFSYFKGNIYVKYLTFYSLPLVTVVLILQNMSSVYFENILIPVSLIGVVAFVASMVSSYFAKKTHDIDEKLGTSKALLLAQLLVFFGVFLMAFMVDYFGIVFYFLIAAAYGFLGVIINHYVNENIETSHRATMLSIKNMFNNLGILLVFPLIGYLVGWLSMKMAFFILFGIFVIYQIIFFIIFRKVKIK
jgi:MFS family permease